MPRGHQAEGAVEDVALVGCHVLVTYTSELLTVNLWKFAYTVVDGAVVQTDMKRNGRLTRYTYNSSHYQRSETFDAERSEPCVVGLRARSGTNLMTAVTVRCQGRDGPIVRTVPATHETKDALVRLTGSLPRRAG
jgi:hypothetical protein